METHSMFWSISYILWIKFCSVNILNNNVENSSPFLLVIFQKDFEDSIYWPLLNWDLSTVLWMTLFLFVYASSRILLTSRISSFNYSRILIDQVLHDCYSSVFSKISVFTAGLNPNALILVVSIVIFSSGIQRIMKGYWTI